MSRTTRREAVGAGMLTLVATILGIGRGAGAGTPQGGSMYGLIGKIRANPGERDALARILLDGISGMPGCRSYVVASDPEDADVLWITEVWDNQDSHRASLSLPSVQQAIAKGRPLIAGFESQIVTEPLGGHGLS